MCDSCDKHHNGNTHAQRVENERLKVEYAKIGSGFTMNAGNHSKEAIALHDMAYWGMAPKSCL
jgi:hypothetical protein